MFLAVADGVYDVFALESVAFSDVHGAAWRVQHRRLFLQFVLDFLAGRRQYGCTHHTLRQVQVCFY